MLELYRHHVAAAHRLHVLGRLLAKRGWAATTRTNKVVNFFLSLSIKFGERCWLSVGEEGNFNFQKLKLSLMKMIQHFLL